MKHRLIPLSVNVSLEQAHRGKCSNGSGEERRACSELRKAKRVWEALKSIPYRYKYYKVLSNITTFFWGQNQSFLTLYQLAAARTKFLAGDFSFLQIQFSIYSGRITLFFWFSWGGRDHFILLFCWFNGSKGLAY